MLEDYFHGFHRDKPHRIASVAKMVPAAGIRIAIDRGLIKDVNVPLCQLFPEYRDFLCEGEKSAITLSHLLTMTTGLQWNEQDVTYFDARNDLSELKSSPDLRTPAAEWERFPLLDRAPPPAPERLVSEERANDRRTTGAKPGSGCACASVMRYCRHLREQPVVSNMVENKQSLREPF